MRLCYLIIYLIFNERLAVPDKNNLFVSKLLLSECCPNFAILVGLGGLEPPASPLSGVRSNQLSYRPKF